MAAAGCGGCWRLRRRWLRYCFCCRGAAVASMLLAMNGTGHDPVLLAKLLQHGRSSGNERLLSYLFRNSGSITDKVAMCVALESCDRVVADAQTTTWRRFTSVLDQPCCCGRTWAPAAREIIRNNCLDERRLCGHLKRALLSGLQKKGDAVCFTGSGNEGKSFLLRPLGLIYQRVSWLQGLSHHGLLKQFSGASLRYVCD